MLSSITNMAFINFDTQQTHANLFLSFPLSSNRRNDYPRRRDTPNHGEYFVPGGEGAPDTAPQSFDHFKRGYQERAHLRRPDRGAHRDDHYFKRHMPRNSDYPQNRHSGGRGGGGRGGGDHYDRRGSNGGSRNYYNGGRGDDRGRSQIIMGLDVGALVDRLCRNSHEVFRELDAARGEYAAVFTSGKAVTAIISNLARRRNLRLANTVWEWVDTVGIEKNTFHYNSMISVCEKVRDYRKALNILDEMTDKNVSKNEVTFSSAISACEKCGQWRIALDLLDQMKREGAGQTAIAYNAAISACEKGLVPHKALEIFEQMKREGVQPTVVTYSALISAAEKGQQWKLALEVLEEMKAAGHGANVIAYSAAISALSKGQMWHKALELFREIEASGGKPSIVTYNATMTALEKGLQWERALDLFDEMKMKNMPITVVSYGSAISACEKGLQYRQCLEFLDEMTQMGIKKNVIIFGAAMSCMEKSCRADIAFQLMDRMKEEDVLPNVHIYNSAISACARCNLWEKGYELFREMDRVGVRSDVVTYNAVLDAVSSQIELGRKLFTEGVEKGFYARVSRLAAQWLELDLHFLSLGGGEIALGWWFEECLVPYLVNTSKLESVQSIAIVTGYGKTRTRGSRMNDDGMRLRVRAMLDYMNIKETPQPNKGRVHIDKQALIEVVKRNGGKIVFDLEGYKRWKEKETTANKYPDAPQQLRARFRPAMPGEGPPGTFIREGGEQNEDMKQRRAPTPNDSYPSDHRDNRRGSGYGERGPNNYQRPNEEWGNRQASYNERDGGENYRSGDDRRGSYTDQQRRPAYGDGEQGDRRPSYGDYPDRRESNFEKRGSYRDDFDRRGNFDRRNGRDFDGRSDRDDNRNGSGHHDNYAHSRQGGPRESNGNYQGQAGNPRFREDYSEPHSGDYRPPQGGSREDSNDNAKKRSLDEFQKQQPNRGYNIEPAYSKRRSS